jgi:cytochrome c biogenesis protein CcmG/thiol:disulfide interchange protein DsbE
MADRRRHRRWRGPAIAIVVLGVLGFVIVIFARAKPAVDKLAADAPLVGKAAPITEGAALDSTTFRLSDHKGQWVLVNFMASWCAACKVEHPELIAFSQRHAQSGDAVVVSIAANDAPADTRKFFADNGGTWPVINDVNGKFATGYGLVALPESYLVDPNGVVRAKFISAVTSSGIDRLIDRFTQVTQ